MRWRAATRPWRPPTRRCTSTAWRSGCARRWSECPEVQESHIQEPQGPECGFPEPTSGLLVEQRLDLRAVDVALVVPVEPRVDHLRQLLAVDGLDRRVDERLTHADRVLGDRAEHLPVLDRLDLAAAGVEPD